MTDITRTEEMPDQPAPRRVRMVEGRGVNITREAIEHALNDLARGYTPTIREVAFALRAALDEAEKKLVGYDELCSTSIGSYDAGIPVLVAAKTEIESLLHQVNLCDREYEKLKAERDELQRAADDYFEQSAETARQYDAAIARAEAAEKKVSWSSANGYWLSENAANIVWNALQDASNEYTYRGDRIGGVLAGCPRAPDPTPQEIAARFGLIFSMFKREIGRS